MNTQFFKKRHKSLWVLLLLLIPFMASAGPCEDLCKEVDKLKKTVDKAEKELDKKKKSYDAAAEAMQDAQDALDEFDEDPTSHGPNVKQQRQRLEKKLEAAKKKYNKAKAAYYAAAKVVKEAIEKLLAKLKEKKDVCAEAGDLGAANQAGRDIDNFNERLGEINTILEAIINSEIGADRKNVEDNCEQKEGETDLAYRQRLRNMIDELLNRIKEIEDKFGKDSDLAKDLKAILEDLINQLNQKIDQNSDESSNPDGTGDDFVVGIFHGILSSSTLPDDYQLVNVDFSTKGHLGSSDFGISAMGSIPGEITSIGSVSKMKESTIHTFGISLKMKLSGRFDFSFNAGRTSSSATADIPVHIFGQDGNTVPLEGRLNVRQKGYQLGLAARYRLSDSCISPYFSGWISRSVGKEEVKFSLLTEKLSNTNQKYSRWHVGPAAGLDINLSKHCFINFEIRSDLRGNLGTITGINFKI